MPLECTSNTPRIRWFAKYRQLSRINRLESIHLTNNALPKGGMVFIDCFESCRSTVAFQQCICFFECVRPQFLNQTSSQKTLLPKLSKRIASLGFMKSKGLQSLQSLKCKPLEGVKPLKYPITSVCWKPFGKFTKINAQVFSTSLPNTPIILNSFYIFSPLPKPGRLKHLK